MDQMSGSHRSESVAEERAREAERRPVEPDGTERPKFPLQIREDEKPKRNGSYEVFVPKAHKTYEEHVPDVTAYTDPNRAESRCSLKSPSSFVASKSERPAAEPRVIQERSLPVKTLIDTFEHNDRPVMRYLQLEERVPLSPEIRHLHDDPPPDRKEPKPSGENGYYTCDTTVETRSFAAEGMRDVGGGDGPGGPEVEDDKSQQFADDKSVFEDDKSVFADDKSVFADSKSVYTDRSEYGDRSEDVRSFQLDAGRSDARFQTVRQLATPDSLESSMLFAQKQTYSDARRLEHHNGYGAGPRQVQGKTGEHRFLHVRGTGCGEIRPTTLCVSRMPIPV